MVEPRDKNARIKYTQPAYNKQIIIISILNGLLTAGGGLFAIESGALARLGRILGRHLRCRIEPMRQHLGQAAFNSYARAAGINLRAINRLADGTWRSVDYESLLGLMALAEELQRQPLLEVVESPLWKSFRDRPADNVALIEQGSEGQVSPAHLDLVKSLNDSDIRIGLEVIDRNRATRSYLRRMMTTRNVLIFGDIDAPVVAGALTVLLSGKVRFPEGSETIRRLLMREAVVLERSLASPDVPTPSGLRPAAAIVVCVNPFGAKNVETVVIAGYSDAAIPLVFEELHAPAMYLRYGAGSPAGVSTVLFFNAGVPRRWRRDGETAERRGGRPRTRPSTRTGGDSSSS
jgi:hypothetical protein